MFTRQSLLRAPPAHRSLFKTSASPLSVLAARHQFSCTVPPLCHLTAVKKYSTQPVGNKAPAQSPDDLENARLREILYQNYKKRQNIFHMAYVVAASIFLFYLYTYGKAIFDQRRREVDALMDYLQRLNNGETVNEDLLFNLIYNACAAILVTTNPLPNQELFLKDQERLFLETPKFWDALLHLMFNDRNAEHRALLESFVTNVVQDRRIANALAKNNFSDVIAHAAQLGEADDPKMSSEQTRQATALLLRLLAHRSTHRYLEKPEVQQLEKMLSNQDFYHYFLNALHEAKNEMLTTGDQAPWILVRFPELENSLCRKAPANVSAEKLKHFLTFDPTSRMCTEKDAKSFYRWMSMVPVILVPVSHYVVHGTRFRWINVQNFRIRALILAASLAVANLVPNQGSVGGPVSLIGQLTAFRLSPFGAITNYVAIKYLDVETSGTKFFFVEGSDKVVV